MINSRQKNMHIWRQDGKSMRKTTFKYLFSPISLFVTMNEYIFIGTSTGTVQKWAMSARIGVVVAGFSHPCYGLFVDVENNLYCSMYDAHQVVKQSLGTNSSIGDIVAGTGTAGKQSNRLYEPRGIFVDINLDLYVADSFNHRIQRFRHGQTHATTVAGHGKAFSIELLRPTSVFIDANNDLFIVDSNKRRIIRSNSNGYQCVAGCSTVSSPSSSQLETPTAATFDKLGNIFVADRTTRRVQKFLLTTESCGKPSRGQIAFKTAYRDEAIFK